MASSDVRSVQRAFKILEVFAESRRAMSLKELTSKVDCPTSSLADLLKTMSRIGCLTFDTDTKTYLPSTRLAALSDWVGQELLASGEQRAALHDLCAETGGTILLGTPNDLDVEYLYVLGTGSAVHYAPGDQGQRPLVRSGPGWMLLSQLDDEAVDRIWRRSIACGLTNRREIPLEKLMERVEFCRANGYAVGRDCRNSDAAIVAITLPAQPHGRRLTIGIRGIADYIEDNLTNTLAILKTCAARVSGATSNWTNTLTMLKVCTGRVSEATS